MYSYHEVIFKGRKKYRLVVDTIFEENSFEKAYVLIIYEIKRYLLFFQKEVQVLRSVAPNDADLEDILDLGKRYINSFV